MRHRLVQMPLQVPVHRELQTLNLRGHILRRLHRFLGRLRIRHNGIGQHGNRLTFARRMLIIETGHSIPVDDQLQGFVVPAIGRVLRRSAAMNQLMAAHVVILEGVLMDGHRLIQAHDEQTFLNGADRLGVVAIFHERLICHS